MIKVLKYLRLKYNNYYIFILLFVLVGCSKNEGDVFRSLSSAKTNIDFSNNITETDNLNILDYLYFYNGGGVAVGDINNDNLPDIFFSANQESNKLYLNKGNFKFEDISESAGVLGKSSWSTGSTMVDINNDGWLDIYVNAVVGINGFDGHNELYINNKDNTFTESAKAYNLDLDTYSSSTAFLDYDLDGDLDLFIINHAVHTQNSFGNVSLRNERNYESGDRLMRNDGEVFVDVSEEAGIYGGVNAYGLGIAISDFNSDGYPDIYVGNDFHEDDYYYLNQGDGTFNESLKEYFGHISRFSMGNDVADINHDGLPDLISLDMLPEDEKTLKSSEGDDNYQTLQMRTKQFGYHYQYTRNMLFLNQPSAPFIETALLSGVAATDWSWSALIQDFNQDGEQDIFISNGIPKRPNDIDFIRFVSSEKIQNKINDTKLVDQTALDLMPSGNVGNYIFEGTSSLQFIDQSKHWIPQDTLVSGATAYGDFDGDGDLDLVINNLNAKASILENTSNSQNYLSIKLQQDQSNKYAIGAKVYVHQKGKLQFKELYTVRGFQASSEPILNFAFQDNSPIDSIRVIWPDNKIQRIGQTDIGQKIEIKKEQGLNNFKYPDLSREVDLMFTDRTDSLGFDFVHEEDRYIDFNRQKLMLFQAGDRGPALATGDWDGDGNTDIFLGGSKFKSSLLYLQKDNAFEQGQVTAIVQDSVQEVVTASMNDFDNDQQLDLFIGTGGGDFFGESEPLLDEIIFRRGDSTETKKISGLFDNASVVKVSDVDNDNDLDVFIGNHIVTNDYGRLPKSYLLINDQGNFEVSTDADFDSLGMVRDAVFVDIDADGDEDLFIVGEWMAPRLFINSNGSFEPSMGIPSNLNGLWQSVLPFDMDNDGDLDFLLGNWGLNSKLVATESNPIKMYYNDFDGNGQTETIVACFKNDGYYPINSFDELSSQLVQLKKKYNTYTEFAGQNISQIFNETALESSEVLLVHRLESGVLRNENGKFNFEPFDQYLQLSPLLDFVSFDFDNNGQEEVLVGGNYFGVTPYHGRFDSFPGALINSEGNVTLTPTLGLDLSNKSVRHLKIITINNKPHLLVVNNNDKAFIFEIRN